MVIEYLPILEQKDNKILTIGKIDRTKAHTNPPVLHATSIIVAVLPDGKIILTDKTEKQISFRVRCSKGTYIRSLCEDIAEKLGTVGLMKELKRTVVGDFKIENAITVEELKEKIENKDYSCLISIEEIFKHNNRIDLNTQDYSKYVNGVKLDIENCKITEFDVTRRNVKEETQKNNLTDETYRIYLDNKFIGLGIVSENKLKRDLLL